MRDIKFDIIHTSFHSLVCHKGGRQENFGPHLFRRHIIHTSHGKAAEGPMCHNLIAPLECHAWIVLAMFLNACRQLFPAKMDGHILLNATAEILFVQRLPACLPGLSAGSIPPSMGRNEAEGDSKVGGKQGPDRPAVPSRCPLPLMGAAESQG